MRRLEIGVVGVGHMGGFHAEKVALLARRGEGVRLAAVADREEARAHEVGQRLGAFPATELREILDRLDAVIVAVPTEQHHQVVEQALQAGRDVLVEKPIAASIDEAEHLLGLAEERGLVLQVGHLEWYNAAMRAIQGMVSNPRFVEVHRLGRYPGRTTDVDVVRDLMIHDLDLVQRLVGGEPERVEAVGVPVLSDSFDIANARLTFPGGCVANLTASRVSVHPMRRLRFFQPDGYFTIDFLSQTAAVFRRHKREGEEPRIEMEELKIDRSDALEAELRAFFRCLRTRETPPGSGAEALSALRTALRVVDAIPPVDEAL